MFTMIAFAIALFFAMNIGASGSAATMGIAYGSGAVKSRTVALVISAIGIFIGASIGGAEVTKTIGSGLVPSSILTVELVIMILASAAITLFIANRYGIPLSTSEVTVGSVIGVGIAYQSVYFGNFFKLVIWWFIVPVVAFILSFLFGKVMNWLERRFPNLKTKQAKKFIIPFVVIAGFLEAVSAGMNNVANAIGPLVGAGLISLQNGMVAGGIFVALGAITLGGKVIETNGKRITDLSLLQGMTVSGTSGILVIIASVFGVPIPMTQITTTGILGVGASKFGLSIFRKSIMKKILVVWMLSPILSLAISFTCVKFIIEDYQFKSLIVSVVTFVIAIGLLCKTIKKNNNAYKNL